MPKKAVGLTARKVETIRTPGLFADGNGLYLQVTATGAKTWIFRYSIGGKRRDMGLGSTTVVSLAQARDKAVEAKKVVAAGTDPLEARKAQEAAQALEAARAVTFKECAASYIESMQAGWKSAKHGAQWTSTLETYAYPLIGSLPINAIDTNLVLKVLEPIWTTKTETASRVRGRIESILDYAKVRGHRSGENPARWRGHLDHILPAKNDVVKVEHHAALHYASMPSFWPKLQVQDGMGARALELAILTATRTSEVLGAKWSEVDTERRVWIIPPERMKPGVEHRVPLTEPTLALLRKMGAIRRGELVFTGQTKDRPLSNMAMNMTLRRMKLDVTPHGFRSTFRTWVAEKTHFPDDVAEAALSHTQGNKVVAAYQRGDLFEKRRLLMQAWAQFVTGLDEETEQADG
ncbi:integrase [Azospirillum sp. OGB3]|uniref:tyrosine-type recombinase/integrase n=1 Tax=Azospirillum sp. OGB3 TaxID=2587012 RepID=UPI001605BCA1|nr:site-specific integrase [Azospirillum sp. OGB3]MBB3264077.1 integrase [Azospirillum sp. OGB3]